VTSAQTLDDADRRAVAAWAADCAEHVVGLFEAEAPGDLRPRQAIERALAYARGELDSAGEIKRRFVAGRAASAATTPAGVSAARAAAQAAAVAHVGSHALGAAAYAARAAALASPDDPQAFDDEVRRQLGRMTDDVREALRRLPRLGEDRSGPLGPGLLASGMLGEAIRRIQEAIGTRSEGARQRSARTIRSAAAVRAAAIASTSYSCVMYTTASDDGVPSGTRSGTATEDRPGMISSLLTS
jgi:hypothetical protein